MADGEQIHSAMYPGSIFGDLFAEQTEINIRQHALESACFVVNATAWLDADQQARIMKDTGCGIGPISGGCFTAIVAPDGTMLGELLRAGAVNWREDFLYRKYDPLEVRRLWRQVRARRPVPGGHAANFDRALL
jgi:hypothetical protein